MKVKFTKVAVFLACLGPCAWLGWRALHQDLTANPIEYITHFTGDWTLRFLLITLAITPLRRLTGQHWLIKFRRMLGLFAFFYVTLHLATYVVLDHFFDFHEMIADVYKRPYITAGMTGLLLMLPLAITSTQGWIRRLGKKWQMVHRLIYFSAAAGVVHYWWLVKADVSKPEQYAVILGGLLGYRVVMWTLKRRQAMPSRTAAANAD
ncbi:MAG TPA: protein-methionine-sulfoxide reductase heme-binding subunit MsrQ [Terriglobales bacterium]|nr:protein-methionine-sulfoxide reductase heme-binding subunit MsrQ [Terriglobales bacterium]